MAHAPWLGLFGSILGGMGQYFGERDNNRRNSREAEKQRQWQKEMSDTSHTREVADLRNAGLNPILSAHKGASTPSGGMIGGKNPMEGMASTAKETMRMIGEIKLLNATAKKTNAEAVTAEANAYTAKTMETVKKKVIESFGGMDALMDRLGYGVGTGRKVASKSYNTIKSVSPIHRMWGLKEKRRRNKQ